ncbi:MAG TPA: hypothetical protein PKI14_01305 [Fervidobacterium sp.]|nr:hypothetical protein [Fervidobacterium sp.]
MRRIQFFTDESLVVMTQDRLMYLTINLAIHKVSSALRFDLYNKTHLYLSYNIKDQIKDDLMRVGK